MAADPLEAFVSIGRILRCGLDPDTVRLCARILLEDGSINPEALSVLVADLEREFGHYRYVHRRPSCQ
jgi:hypothetical protein